MRQLLFAPMPLSAPVRLCVSRSVIAAQVTTVDDWRQGVPNALTCGRVLAIPLLAAAFCFRGRSSTAARAPAAIFAACAATDWLDGYLARRWGAASPLGAFLDPVADKLLVCTCLVLLSGALGAVVSLPTAIIVCREVAVSALREWMGARGQGAVVAVGWQGKVKTATQMTALTLLLLARSGTDQVIRQVGLLLLYVAAILTCTSAMGYAVAAWPALTERVDAGGTKSEAQLVQATEMSGDYKDYKDRKTKEERRFGF